jgi:hypothetical protein
LEDSSQRCGDAAFVIHELYSVRYVVLLITSCDGNFVIGVKLLKPILQLNWGCLLMVGTSHTLFLSSCVQH